MGAVGKKLREPVAGLRDGFGPDNANRVEAAIRGGRDERALQRGGIIQKSRSA